MNFLAQAPADEPYTANERGIRVPQQAIEHRDEEYAEEGFQTLLQMQDRHFWYRGRHRFLLHAVSQTIRKQFGNRSRLDGVDLGGGCGGWVQYLRARAPRLFSELALADSSAQALEFAKPVVGENTPLYQIDLLKLGWRQRWDVAFLLDVLEHIPKDLDVLKQIFAALRPGGLLFVTCPALKAFWSYNDVLAKHCRRYSRADFRRLGAEAGFEVLTTRYFQFFLSPLYALSRATGPDPAAIDEAHARDLMIRTHHVPSRLVNKMLSLIFGFETPLGWRYPFPWGTSVLGVFRRP